MGSILVRYRYDPTDLAIAPYREDLYTQTSNQAFKHCCCLLAYCSNVREVTSDGAGSVTIILEEKGRNTGSLFEHTFTGTAKNMLPCLVAAYYWYDGHCVEPPADYPFAEPAHRQMVLDGIKTNLPLRNHVGELLRLVGYTPPELEGLYDIRGCGRGGWIGCMVYSGITDQATLTEGVGMSFDKLFEACEYVRELGLTFAEARAALE